MGSSIFIRPSSPSPGFRGVVFNRVSRACFASRIDTGRSWKYAADSAAPCLAPVISSLLSSRNFPAADRNSSLVQLSGVFARNSFRMRFSITSFR